jgi:hypothetical protein
VKPGRKQTPATSTRRSHSPTRPPPRTKPSRTSRQRNPPVAVRRMTHASPYRKMLDGFALDLFGD